MKRTICVLLALLLCVGTLALTGCGNASDSTASISSTPEFYTQVWDAFGEANQFSCSGGDADHATEGPGLFQLTEENKDTFTYLLHVSDALYAMLDTSTEAATMQHMMNLNTFSSAVVKLSDGSKAGEFAEGYRTAIQAQQWMCGFPDRVVVIGIGDYVVLAYGLADNIDNLITACTTVAPEATVLVNDAAVLE